MKRKQKRNERDKNTRFGNGTLKCRFCFDVNTDYGGVASMYLEKALDLSSYLVVKDGGEWPQYECFDCGEESLIPADKEYTQYFCAACDTHYASDDIQFCSGCGTIGPAEETGVCDSCIHHHDDD